MDHQTSEPGYTHSQVQSAVIGCPNNHLNLACVLQNASDNPALEIRNYEYNFRFDNARRADVFHSDGSAHSHAQRVYLQYDTVSLKK
jgi:hypothetical protein